MAISSAMYAAVTGLSALGTGMQTISNNIANVNTVGFKAGRTNYEDLISQNYFSGGKVNQRGTGVRVSSIQSMFTQGSFMSSAQDTDMAITGEGFFSVRNAVTGAINYTRAGNFTMTKDGELEDPNGNILQGWQMSIPKPGQEAVRIGTPTDVKVTVLNAPPVASSVMKVVANLNAEDDPQYLYKQFELADVYAKEQAEPAAENARIQTIAGIYPTTDSPKVSLIKDKYDDATGQKLTNTMAEPAEVVTSTDDIYDASFLKLFNERYSTAPELQNVTDLKVVNVDEPAKGTLTSGATFAYVNNSPTGGGKVTKYTINPTVYDTNFIERYNNKFKPSSPIQTTAINNIRVVELNPEAAAKPARPTGGVKGTPATIGDSNYNANFLELYMAAYPNCATTIGGIQVATVNMTKGTLTHATMTYPSGAADITPSEYDASFIEKFDKKFNTTVGTTTGIDEFHVVSDAEAAAAAAAGTPIDHAQGFMSQSEFNELMGAADVFTEAERQQGYITLDEYDALMKQSSVISQAQRDDGYMTKAEFDDMMGDATVLTQADRNQGFMTQSEYEALLDDATGPIAIIAKSSAGTYIPVQTSATLKDTVGAGSDKDHPVYIDSPDPMYNQKFLEFYNTRIAPIQYKGKVADLKVVVTGTTLTTADRENGYMLDTDYNAVKSLADQAAQYSTGLGHFTNENNYFYSTIAPWPENQNATYNEYFSNYFIAQYNSYHPGAGIQRMDQFKVVDDSSVLNSLGTSFERQNGFLTKSEFDSLVISARAEARSEASAKGRDAYNTLYNNIYNSTYNAITARLTDWQLEGNGFAGAWNAQDNPPIKPENYTYPQSLTIFDSLGAEHKLNVYYQPNPHMDNVWDYIITCDPLEDARKDSNNSLLMSDSASFSGLIQKGKITFSADGPDRHGGEIKDIEAQNIDLEKCKMATIDPKSYDGSASTTMRNATIGGYYKGSPAIDPYSGVQRTTEREYTVRWGGNVKGDPETSGMVWSDSEGNTGIIPVYDKQFAGPYNFGSGLSITFDTQDLPLRFAGKDTDAIKVVAHSEQMAWTNLEPNKEGYFDFDVAFVQSASMALHPPYPEGMPTMIQNIALDMGAKNPYGLDTKWTLDDQSTTQYAAKSNTIFASSDGYASGSLQRISIGTDGVLTGVFSNGRNQPLYQIGLTRFLNPWGLSKLGDNLFEATRYSGEGAMNEPGTAGNGTILANFLEQSNVDLAEEIVNMIVTQRGFQANSKTVTTTDTMLSEVIEMKR